MVSDAHFDARQVFLDQDQFRLVAAIDNDGTIEEDLDGHFMTTQGRPITPAQVEESKTKPKARRSFKLQKEGLSISFERSRRVELIVEVHKIEIYMNSSDTSQNQSLIAHELYAHGSISGTIQIDQ